MFEKIRAIIGLAVVLLGATGVHAQVTIKQIDGVLEDGDKNFEDGSLLDGYTIGLREGQSFTISASSDQFDLQVVVINPDGRFASTTDAEKGKKIASVEVRAERGKGGRYQFLIAGKGPGQKGRYIVELTSTRQILDVILGPDGKEMVEEGPGTPDGTPDDKPKPPGGEGASSEPSPGKNTGGWIHNKLEDSDDPYAGREYRNDVYVLALKPGDVLGAQIVTDGFVPELMSGWEGGRMNGPRADGYREDPKNEAVISLVGATRAGNYKVMVLSEHRWKKGENWNYKIRFNVNGRIIQSPSGITSEGGEGAGDVTVDTSKFAALTPTDPSSGDGGEQPTTNLETNDGTKIEIPANGYVDRYNQASTYAARDEANAIGAPDEKFSFTQSGGSGMWEFADNRLVDGPGIDLAIISVGDDGDESYRVEISKDGIRWQTVAEGDGGIHGIDISKGEPTGDLFRYVKITDTSGAAGPFPGPDIDAIGAVNSQPFQPEIVELITPENLHSHVMMWQTEEQLDDGDETGHYQAPMDYIRVALSDEHLATLDMIEMTVFADSKLASRPELKPKVRLFSHWKDQDVMPFSDPNLAPKTVDGKNYYQFGLGKESIKGPFYIGIYPGTLDSSLKSGDSIKYTVSLIAKKKSGDAIKLSSLPSDSAAPDPSEPAEPAGSAPEKIEVEVLGVHFPYKPDGYGAIKGNKVELYGTMSINGLKESPDKVQTAVPADSDQPARIIDRPREDSYKIQVDALVEGVVEIIDPDAPSQSDAWKFRQELLNECQLDLKLKRTFTIPASCRTGADKFIISLRSHFTERDVLKRNDDEWGFTKLDVILNDQDLWNSNSPNFGRIVHQPKDMLPLIIYFAISRPGTIVER